MALAASVEKPVSSLLLAATEDGRKGEETLRTLQAWVGTQREVLKGLQLLPDRDDLAQLSRYEASLFRDLQRTLYELEARKARRRGETVHLAQIQVETGPAAGSGG